MQPRFLPFPLSVLLLVAAASPARAQRQAPPTILPPGTVANNGSIYVHVLAQSGSALSVSASVVMTTGGMDGPVMNRPEQVSQDVWAFIGLEVGSPYVIRVEAEGYQTTREYVTLAPIENATKHVYVYMVPEGRPPNASVPPPGHFLLSPAAQREVQEAIEKLKAGHISAAQKHLKKALAMAPGHPGVNYLMGLSYLRANQESAAMPYLEKSVSIDPGEVPALLALATVRYRQSKYAEAIDLLHRVVARDPGTWQAHWILAGCYLREGKYERARQEAETALKAGKKKAFRAQLVLGEALTGLGERKRAIAAYEDFLKESRHDPAAAQVRAELNRLRQPVRVAARGTVGAATPTTAASRAAPTPSEAFTEKAAKPAAPAAAPVPAASVAAAPAAIPVPVETPSEMLPKENWAPPDVDAAQPTIVSGQACPLPALLANAGRGAVEWVRDLEKFTAIEEYQSAEINRHGVVGTPFEQRFNYLVFVRKLRPHLFTIEEVLDPPPVLRQMGAPVIALGSPALALVFHPDFQRDYSWSCDGLGEWNGERAWILRFRQRPNRPTAPLQSFDSASGSHLLALKGLVWLSEKGGHVMRLETDLVKAVDALRLEREHFSIEYRLVRFRSHPVKLWLPERVDLYVLYRGHAYHNYSRFSRFELFWTGTTQSLGKAKTPGQRR